MLEGERAFLLPGLAGEFSGVLRAPIALDQALHVMGGAVQGDHEEGLFGGLAGHAGESAHFGVAQFTAGHGGGDLGQAHEGNLPSAQPLRRSNSPIRVSQR